MDQTRQLSSPSPTSPFLFHHSEKFKSSSLTPLLSSTADVTAVEDCFSAPSSHVSSNSSAHHHGKSHRPSYISHLNIQSHTQQHRIHQHLNHDQQQTHHHHHHQHQHHHHHHHHQNNHDALNSANTIENHHSSNHHHNCVIDSANINENGVDDDDVDDMHNILSGSSASSNSTLPLLPESHNNSFSRISLNGYSPLSLNGEDCDSSLPVSPNSLAYKSLNGIKIDSLVNCAQSIDHDAHTNGVSMDVVDRHNGIGDVQSLSSPTLMSASVLDQQDNWHNNEPSASQFMFNNHHHNHQLSSFMQHLEPQPLGVSSPIMSHHSLTIGDERTDCISTLRSSSEPPIPCTVEPRDIAASLSFFKNPSDASKSKLAYLNYEPTSDKLDEKIEVESDAKVAATTEKSRSRQRATPNKSVNSNQSTTTVKPTPISSPANKKQIKKGQTQSTNNTKKTPPPSHHEQNSSNNSFKLHLHSDQYSKKLEELQKRLFGTCHSDRKLTDCNTNNSENKETKTEADSSATTRSDANNKNESTKTDTSKCFTPPSTLPSKVPASTTKTSTTASTKPKATPRKRNHSSKSNSTINKPSSSLTMNDDNVINNSVSTSDQHVADTEKAEADTTTSSKSNSEPAIITTQKFDSTRDLITSASQTNDESFVMNIDVLNLKIEQIHSDIDKLLTDGEPMQSSTKQNTNVFAPKSFKTECIPPNSQTLNKKDCSPSHNSNEERQVKHPTNQTEQHVGDILKTSHQIAIQVICQDGTSLVLPVTSSTNCDDTQSNSKTTLNISPISLSNLVAQQSSNLSSKANIALCKKATSKTSSLAASSPTLAALLDDTTYYKRPSEGVPKEVGKKLKNDDLDDASLNNSLCEESEKSPRDSNQKSNSSLSVVDADFDKSDVGSKHSDTSQPFKCEHCDSTFTRLGNFTRHKKIHTVPTKDGQRFKCEVCSKSFLQRCDLARHLHIHRGTEPHRCSICGKGYIRHSDLVTHQRFHNKEKPFGCSHCNKGFCQRGDLNRHLRSIHLQMKPILCPCCNRKFAKQETLLRHLNASHMGKSAGVPDQRELIAPESVVSEITQDSQ